MEFVNSIGSKLPVVALSVGLNKTADYLMGQRLQGSWGLKHSFALMNMSLSIYGAAQICKVVGFRIFLNSFSRIAILSSSAYIPYLICDYLYPKSSRNQSLRAHVLDTVKLGISSFTASKVATYFDIQIPFKTVCEVSLLLKINLEALRYIERKLEERRVKNKKLEEEKVKKGEEDEKLSKIEARYKAPCERLKALFLETPAAAFNHSLKYLREKHQSLREEWIRVSGNPDDYVKIVSTIIDKKMDENEGRCAFLRKNNEKLIECMIADDTTKATYSKERQEAIGSFKGKFDAYKYYLEEISNFIKNKWTPFEKERDTAIELRGTLKNDLESKKKQILAILQELYPDRNHEEYFTQNRASLFVTDTTFGSDELPLLDKYLSESTLEMPTLHTFEGPFQKKREYVLYIIKQIKCFRILDSVEAELKKLN